VTGIAVAVIWAREPPGDGGPDGEAGQGEQQDRVDGCADRLGRADGADEAAAA
jgi:hypothetical protein